jgi:glycosyltransferase involved in cell wall biosynthesis
VKIYYLVPCRNEQENIHLIVADFLSKRKLNEVLILIEGGSTDKSEIVAKNYAKFSLQNEILFLSQIGEGKFKAVLTAINFLSDTDDEIYIVIWDSDYSIRFEDAQRAADLVALGNKFVFTERIGSYIEKGAMPFINNVANRVIASLASLVYGFPIADALSGTKAFPLAIFKELNFDFLNFIESDTYGDLSYFLLAKKNDLQFVKFKVDYFARTYGVSGLNRFSNGLELIKNLGLSLKLLRRNYERIQ